MTQKQLKPSPKTHGDFLDDANANFTELYALIAALSAPDSSVKYLPGNNLLIDPNFNLNPLGYVDGTDLVDDEYCYSLWRSWGGETTDNGVSVTGETVVFDDNTHLEHISDDLIAYNGAIVTASVKSGSVIAGDSVAMVEITPESPYTFTLNASATEGFRINGANATFSGLKLNAGEVASGYEIPQVTLEVLKLGRYVYAMDFVGCISASNYDVCEAVSVSVNGITGQVDGGEFLLDVPVIMRNAVDMSIVVPLNTNPLCDYGVEIEGYTSASALVPHSASVADDKISFFVTGDDDGSPTIPLGYLKMKNARLVFDARY